MNFRLAFLTPFAKSTYNPRWLALARRHTGYAWQYFGLLTSAFLLLHIFVFVAALPSVAELHTNAIAKLQQAPDFSIDIVGGNLSLHNVPMPFVWSMVDDERVVLWADTETSTLPEAKQLAEKQDAVAAIVIGKTGVSFFSPTQGMKYISFAQFAEMHVTRADAAAYVDRVLSPSLYGWLVMTMVLFFFFGVLINFIAVLATASAAYAIGKVLRKTNWTWRETFNAGMLGATLPFIFSSIVYLSPLIIAPLSSLLLLAVILSAMWAEPTVESTEPAV